MSCSKFYYQLQQFQKSLHLESQGVFIWPLISKIHTKWPPQPPTSSGRTSMGPPPPSPPQAAASNNVTFVLKISLHQRQISWDPLWNPHQEGVVVGVEDVGLSTSPSESTGRGQGRGRGQGTARVQPPPIERIDQQVNFTFFVWYLLSYFRWPLSYTFS